MCFICFEVGVIECEISLGSDDDEADGFFLRRDGEGAICLGLVVDDGFGVVVVA